jgi:hypothetical protein
METINDFEVTIKRNIPFLSKFTYWTLMIICAALLLLCVIFIPTAHQSLEMKTVYLILVIPESIQAIIAYLSIGAIVFFILNLITKRHDKAVLTFFPDKIQIIGENISRVISVSDIVTAYCMDNESLRNESREQLTIYIEDKNKIETAIRLTYYEQADDFMGRLMSYENLNLRFYNFNVSPNSENED